MNTAVFYHLFWPPSELTAYNDLTLPVVLAIATLRAVNSTIPIYVLECGPHRRNWGHFPFKLNFEVVAIDACLGTTEPHSAICSRLFDVGRFASSVTQDIVLYSDVDIFWKRDPIPLDYSGCRFSVRDNFGLFYYDTTSPQARAFVEAYKDCYFRCMSDKEFCHQTHVLNVGDKGKGLPDHVFRESLPWDESCSAFVRKEMPECHQDLTPREHNLFLMPFPEKKMEHLTALDFRVDGRNLCGLAGLLFVEFYALISSVLNDQELTAIFGDFMHFQRWRVPYEDMADMVVTGRMKGHTVWRGLCQVPQIMPSIREYRFLKQVI